jgi:hypothetical protein
MVPMHQEAAMELCSYHLNGFPGEEDDCDTSVVIRKRWPELTKAEIMWALDLAEEMMDLFDRVAADR